MFSVLESIKSIKKKVELIQTILDEYDGKISLALQDEVKTRPAILMHLVSIAEQFNKLKNNNEFEVLEHFTKYDLKGINDIRNFIAHDYDGVDLAIIEDVLRYGLSSLLQSINLILKESNI